MNAPLYVSDHTLYPIHRHRRSCPVSDLHTSPPPCLLSARLSLFFAQERDCFARGLKALHSHPASQASPNHPTDIRHRIMDIRKENLVKQMFSCPPLQGCIKAGGEDKALGFFPQIEGLPLLSDATTLHQHCIPHTNCVDVLHNFHHSK